MIWDIGLRGDRLEHWRFEAHPNLCPTKLNPESQYSRKPSRDRVEFSVSVRYPKKDYPVVLDLLGKHLIREYKEFEELSDNPWAIRGINVKTYLPLRPLKGRRRTDDRRILNGTFYLLQTGCSFGELPRRYGSYYAVRRRWRQWSGDGC